MKKRAAARLTAAALAAVMAIGYMPSAALAAQTGQETAAAEESSAADEPAVETAAAGAETEETAAEQTPAQVKKAPAQESTQAEETETAQSESGQEEEKSVSDYATFLEDLKVLEDYADRYATENSGKDARELVLNYVRTGVAKYAESTWSLVAGPEDTAFTAYVAEQDKTNGTSAGALRNLQEFTIPNGQTVEFKHMFGTMNITWYQRNNAQYGLDQADMGGWAGDVCDLMSYTNGKVTVAADADDAAVDTAAKEIRTKYLGIDDPTTHTFGILDLYGDLDAYYFMSKMQADSSQKLSFLMESYYTADLKDADRADYFMTNRLSGTKTKAGVRAKLLKAYTSNSMIDTLEKSRSLNGDSYTGLRKACVYAFADYLTNLAGDENSPGTDPETPETGETDTPETGETETPETDDNGLDKNKYYTEFSRSLSTLAPGVEQRISYATSADDKQMVYYMATVDISRDDLSIYATYKDYDGSKYGMARVTEQMASAAAKRSDPASEDYIENFTPILGINGSFYNMSNGAPMGALVINGVTYADAGNEYTFFGILDDDTPIIGGSAEWAANKDHIREAVGGGSYLIKDGKVSVGSSSDYYNSRASRTCIGITEDGKVVMMVLDGRQEPFSCGGSAEEIAQIMLDAGCQTAINLDGGGSTTFAAKEEGETAVKVINRPSDGFERSVSGSLMVASTAPASDQFDHAKISAEDDYQYLTKNSDLQLTAKGVNSTGGPADLPEGTSWKVADPSVGTIDKNGKFTAASNGTTDVQLIGKDGNVLGSITLNVVTPDRLGFEKDNITTVYEATVPLPLQAYYKGNSVKVMPADVTLKADPAKGGTIDGFQFTACKEEVGCRNVEIEASLNMDLTISAKTEVNIYGQGEAVFDFDNVDGGDRHLAWTREVSNSTKEEMDDLDIYHAQDPSLPMDVSYVFALDMRQIPIPEKLQGLVKMVAGGDLGNVTPWKLLLQLAGRVSELTTVEVDLHLDSNMDVDYSNLKIVTDYFHLDEDATVFDKDTNTLKCFIRWDGDESEPIAEEDANPICIVSGLKLTPKADASWKDNQLTVNNSGSLSYDIYLAASALYTDNFQSYGLYKYDNSQGGTKYVADGSHLDKGAHFVQEDFQTFEDSFVLDKTVRQGWYSENDQLFYYKDNKKLTGIQEVPGYKDESNKYYYRFDENGVSQGKVTGLFEKDGGKYYAIGGLLKTRWQAIPNDKGVTEYYFFNTWSHQAMTGTCKIGDYTYQFDDNGVLVRGDLVKNDTGYRYNWAGDFVYRQWVELDGNKYYAGMNGYFFTGVQHLNSPEDGVWHWYVFDKDGRWMQDFSGIYEDANGYLYLVKDGWVVEYPGLVKVDGHYYYFSYCITENGVDHMNVAARNRTYWITKTNGIIPEQNCVFDEHGWLISPEIEEPGLDSIKSGIYYAENGDIYYIDNGKVDKTKNGLVRTDSSTRWFEEKTDKVYAPGSKNIYTAEEYYYFVDGKAVKDKTLWVENTNNLLPQWDYKFDANGIIEHEDVTMDGIQTLDGVKYYYIDGIRVHMGMFKIGKDYYYAKRDGKLITGQSYYCSRMNDTGLTEGTYQFDDDGKLIIETKKNGIVAENGSLFYYADGKISYAGLIKIDGSYYYVRTSGEVVHGRKYWITKTNDLMPQGSYEFDDQGRMVNPPKTETGGESEVKNGIVSDFGSLYYYVDGKLTYAGLIKIDGNYYYVRTSGEVVHGRKYWITKTNGLMPEAAYEFDDQGRMVQ